MSRKEKLKVYHGLPKSVIDEHTIFYGSFDKSIYPEIGDRTPINLTPNFNTTLEYKSPTGGNIRGLYSPDVTEVRFKSNANQVFNEFTVDFWTDIKAGYDTSKTYRVLVINGIDFTLIGSNYCIGYWENRVTIPKSCVIGLQHVRITLNRKDKSLFNLNLYINGSLFYSGTTTLNKEYTDMFVTIGHSIDSVCRLPISDLHISNIDRGDYFPNLPQDFIDGKAIIKPRMGQQQIKGDPFYSQETTTCIPAYVGDNTKLYIIESNKSGTLINNPEIFGVVNASTWGDNISGFKIRSFNGEIISGIIDSDTALCKITKNSGTTTNLIYVDDTNKLSVGDTLEIFHTKTQNTSNIKLTITNIDAINKVITTDNSVPYFEGDMVIETTASTSSPIVKTSDGVVVNGTWKNLGTTEATFTLGTNTSITGKDLYVTYSLNISAGNSDFDELPYAISKVYDENGTQLQQVSEILIEDDFLGKVPKSTIECPHKLYTCINGTIKKPSDITGDWGTGFEEISTQVGYNTIMYADNNSRSVSGGAGTIAQQLITFNIIELVERKIGKIPAQDKVAWLKSNVDGFIFNVYAYGSGGFCYFKFYRNNAWNGGVTIIGTTLKLTNYVAGSSFTDMIMSDGNINLILYGQENTTIYFDYISLGVKLKTVSNYETFYSTNTRAREFPCNPIMIQKDTKTIRRYVPGDKCFSTELLYYNCGCKMQDSSFIDTNITNALTPTKNYITSQGTGSLTRDIPYRNLISKILKDSNFGKSYLLKNDPVITCGNKYNLYINETGMFIYNVGHHLQKPHDPVLPDSLEVKSTNYAHVFYRLYSKDGELFIAVSIHLFINGTRNDSKYYYCSVPLPNRPLIK